MSHNTKKTNKKNEVIRRANQFSQNSTIVYREQLFRLDPEFSGHCS